MPLEIIPEKDPTTLRAGDEFPVRVLRNGAPLVDFSLGIVREGRTNRAFKKTDVEGRAVFKVTARRQMAVARNRAALVE